MRALKQLWTPTSRLYDRADEGQSRKFVLDCGIAWQNYLDGNNVFQEINLTPQPSDIAGYDWTVPGLPFKPYFALNGARRIFVDRNSQVKRIDFPASRFLFGKTFTKIVNSLVWSSNDYDVIMRWENSRIKFDVVVKRNIPFDQVQFDVDKTGLTDDELKAFMTSLKAIDSSPIPIVRPLYVSIDQGVLTIGFDLTGMTFPVTIDPTIDAQVGAGTDDGMYLQDTGTYFNNNGWNTNIGDQSGDNYAAFYRLTGFSGLTGVTVDASYITQQKRTVNGGSPLTKIRAERADAPAAPTTAADARGRTLTTAGVDWDSPAGATDTWINSPSLNTVFQEIVDNQNPTVIQIFHLDDGGLNDATYNPWAYDGDTTKATKLHIEYTAGGTTAYRDVTTRLRLNVQAFRDAATRSRVTVLGYKDSGTRFLTTVQAFSDAVTRARVTAQSFRDTSTRFLLAIQGFTDVATRFRTVVQSFVDAPTRFLIQVQEFRDSATRFILSSTTFKDVATRFIVSAFVWNDAVTRFVLNVLGYNDATARFKLNGRGYEDPPTRFLIEKWVSTGAPFLYLAVNWGEVLFYLESEFSASSGTVLSRLYDITSSVPVSGSEISTSSTSLLRIRSSAFSSLVNGHEYRVQFGSRNGDFAGNFMTAKLIAI